MNDFDSFKTIENATLSRAIIRYDGAPKADPTAPMTSGPTDGALIEADLRPLVPTKVVKPDVSMTFDLVVVSIFLSCSLDSVSDDCGILLDYRQGTMEH